jgi:transcriptional regulator with XRE-family HTH domain
MRLTGKQIAAARELLGFSQADLAAAIGVSRQTIANFEQGVSQPYARTLDAIQQELERRGIEFTNGSGIGVRLDFAKAEAASAASARTDSKG